MFLAYIVVTSITILLNVGISIADVTRSRFVLANMAETRVPESWLWPLAILKTSGAAGLGLGLLGVPWIGLAAGVGLVLFYVGAVGQHVRTRVFHTMAFPLTYLAFAIGSLVLVIAAG